VGLYGYACILTMSCPWQAYRLQGPNVSAVLLRSGGATSHGGAKEELVSGKGADDVAPLTCKLAQVAGQEVEVKQRYGQTRCLRCASDEVSTVK
jgi:hypothetical protein